MSEIKLKAVHKAAVIGWDGDKIKGSTISLQAEDQEKRTVQRNPKSEGNLFFPLEFSGKVKVTVEGSKSGQATGTIEIP